MDPREYLLRYFTDLDKIDIPINVKDNSFGGRLSRFGSRIGTPVKNFINRKASIPNLLIPRSSTIPSPWGGSITSNPAVNTLGGEVVDVVSSKPQSFLSKVRGLPQRLAGNSQVQKLLGGANNPVTKRFAGKLGPLKNVPLLNPVIATGMGIHRLGEGKAPLDAFGRPIFQTGGMLLGAGTGFFADSPFSPAADLALGYAGWESGGRMYDALFDRDKDIEIGTKELTMVDGTKVTVPIELVNGQEVGVEVDEFPNDFRKPSSHLEENRGPKHLVTGEGPKHLETGEGPKHLSEKVDKFLEDKKVGKGKTRWVGKNSTWVDRNGIVIAPRVNEKGEVVGPNLGENISDY
jgi:hypothetical protein